MKPCALHQPAASMILPPNTECNDSDHFQAVDRANSTGPAPSAVALNTLPPSRCTFYPWRIDRHHLLELGCTSRISTEDGYPTHVLQPAGVRRAPSYRDFERRCPLRRVVWRMQGTWAFEMRASCILLRRRCVEILHQLFLKLVQVRGHCNVQC